MGSIRRVAFTLLAVAVATVGVAAAPAAAANGEGSFVNKMNAARSARGLAPLEVYWDLVDDARAHSAKMKAEDHLHHNPNLASVTSGWQGLGENVGVGPSVANLHQAFMDSAGHRANILGNFNYVGVGVVKESDSKMWVTVVFMRGPAGLVTPVEDPPPAEEPPPEPPPAAEPPAQDPPAPEPRAEEPPAPSPPVASPKAPASSNEPTKVAAAPEPDPPPGTVWEPSPPCYGTGRFAPYVV